MEIEFNTHKREITQKGEKPGPLGPGWIAHGRSPYVF
jgi:hypothetical protein